jgi:hypothetical protein
MRVPSKPAVTRKDVVEPAREVSGPKGERGVTALLKIAGAIVTVVSGIIGLLFLLLPGLRPDEPPANQQAKLSELSLDPNISRAQYLARTDSQSRGYTKKELAVRGAFIECRVEIIGYKGQLIVVKWELIDASSGEELHDEKSDGFIPDANQAAATQPLFVPLPRREGSFYVRLELVRQGEYRLVSLDKAKTERFPGVPQVR